MADYQTVTHGFAPIYDEYSHILILGTMPSVKSRENQFYYGHPQNRFWRVVSALLGQALPNTVQEKEQLLLGGHIALWDVLKSCEIVGSDDHSIRNEQPNEMAGLLGNSQITQIFTNGKKASLFYQKYCLPQTKQKDICLPSTSPANAVWTLPKLIQQWEQEISSFLR